jgi:putative ABC transport system permease protein
MMQDLRYGIRSLLRTPSFTVLAIATLALGIGVTAAMFSFVDAVLLKPLDYPDAERLVVLQETFNKGGTSNPSPLTYTAWKQNNRSFTHVSIYGNGLSMNLSEGAGAEQVAARYVSADYFDMLGIRPLVGRWFAAGEDQIGNEKVAVLTNSFWRRRFSGDEDLVGAEITLNRTRYTVVGVLPRSDAFDRSGTDLWIPQTIRPDQMRRTTQFFNVWARLKPGVTLAQANDDLRRIAEGYNQEGPAFWRDTSAAATPLRETLVSTDLHSALLVLMGTVLFILLIAIVNVSNLLLVRSAARRQEIVIRKAIGASQSQVVRQFAMESLLLAVTAGVLGLWLAGVLLHGLLPMIPGGMLPQQAAIAVDWRVAVFTCGLAMVAGLIFGVAPAAQSARVALSRALNESAQNVSTRVGRIQSRVLLVGEVALTFALVVGASLMIRSLDRLVRVDPGFDASHMLVFRTALTPARYSDLPRVGAYLNEMKSQVASLPGVISVSATNSLPLSGRAGNNDFTILHRNAAASSGNAAIHTVDADYFHTMGARLLAGRFFVPSDGPGAARAVVINQAAALRYWPGEDPVGQGIRIFGPKPYTVIGVMGDIHHRGLNAPAPVELYFTLGQFDESVLRFFIQSLTFIVRTSGEPLGHAKAIQEIARTMDREQPIYGIETMDTVIAGSVATPRLRTIVFGVFGTLGVLLTLVGVYGVMSYSASQRRKEIGIRMALGARPGDIFSTVMLQGLMLAGTGVIFGLAGSFWLTGLLKTFLFGVSPTDRVSFALTAVVLFLITVLATWVPARRAMRTDPLLAIRQ